MSEAAARRRLEAEALGDTLPPLLVAAERVAATVLAGGHGRRRVGRGDSFWQFRPYAAGDPASRIDWRETAKREHAHIREQEWMAADTVWLWRDGSASMDWHSGPGLPTKRDRAGLLVLALASLLLRGGERVGLLGSGQRPGTGRAALGRLARDLAPPSGAISLDQAPLPPRHGTLVVITDFLAPVPVWQAQLCRLAAQGLDLHLLQVLDPAEETLPYDGRVRFEGLEAEPALLVPRVEGLRAAYQARLAAHRADLAALARSQGWSFAHHHTDQPPERALMALAQRLGGGRRG